MKRVFYIANAYDGAYFVLTDDIEVFYQRMGPYAVNLQNSTKCNTYSFGSLEMSEADYRRKTTEAEELETSQIQVTKQELEVEILAKDVFEDDLEDFLDDELEDLFEEKSLGLGAEALPKKEKGHLRLV